MNLEKNRAKCRAYHDRHRQKERARSRAYYAANAERILAQKAERVRTDGGVIRNRSKRQYRKHLMNKKAKTFGLSVEALLAIRDGQDGACALCRKRAAKCVDHDHATNVVRGWLCVSCNIALGILGDSPERMERVMAYVERGRVPIYDRPSEKGPLAP